MVKAVFLILVALGFPAATWAQTLPPSSGSTRFGDGLRQMDANRDGKISRSEVEDSAHQRFQNADRNHDGKLTANELAAIGVTGAEDAIKRLDRDGDGAMSLEEYLDDTLASFDTWDSDHDGVWSPQEQQAAIAASAA